VHQGLALRDVSFFVGEMKIRFDIALQGSELGVRRENCFRGLALLENLLRLFLVLPKIRLRGFYF